MKYQLYFAQYLDAIEKTLDEILPASDQPPGEIHKAMRYAVFPALLPAAAVELIHSYSLVHDDLPALDNDDERRGRPSCHKQFGEAMAVLAGDGLLTLAFQALSQVRPAGRAVRMAAELSTAAGSYGMIGGQVADLETGPEGLTLPHMDYINIHKTGKLIKAAAVCGALAGDANREALRHLTRYGECLGLAFQSVDDLHDGDGYLKLIKAREVRMKVRDLIAQAKRELRPLGENAAHLMRLADFLLAKVPKGNHASVDR